MTNRLKMMIAVVLVTLAWHDLAQAQTVQPTPIIKKAAVIIFSLQDRPNVPTAATARTAVFTGTGSVNAFYKRNSYGKLRFEGAYRQDGDVYGPYALPYLSTDANGKPTCDYLTWASAARTIAQAQGYNKTMYNQTVYIWSSDGCWRGAWSGGGISYVPTGRADPRPIAHEMGHGLVLNHANAWVCRDPLTGLRVAISSQCTEVAYGDFALMGKTTYFELNGFHRALLGFFSSTNVLDVTQSGTYTLAPLEVATSRVQVLRIYRSTDANGNKDFYYLEFRQPVGFDGTFPATDPRVKGVQIRVGADYKTAYGRLTTPKLLDVTTPAETGFGDAALQVGATFKGGRVSVQTLSVSSTGAQVRIVFK